VSWGKPKAGYVYPSAVMIGMNGLEARFGSDTMIRPGPPPNYDFSQKLMTVRRVGGGPDEEDLTDYPVLQIACFASSYTTAALMQKSVENEVLSWPLTMINAAFDGEPPWLALVDEAELYVGEQEIPDVYLDERRVVATYRLGLRRQFRP
jgi:hypothetical protein